MANTEKIVVQVVVQGEKDLQRVGKTADKSTKSFGKLTKSMAKAGAGILAAVTAFKTITSVISTSIKTFRDFEFQMAKVKAVSGATERDFKKLSSTAKELGRTTFFTATQVGSLQENYAKLGFTTDEILNAQQATIELATATGSDLARAAIVAGSAVRGFGLDASETQRVVDVMAVSFTSSAMDIEKWQTSMTKVAPIAKSAGFSIEDTAALMSKLADSGIEASIAGTSLRNILLKMQSPTSDLTKAFGGTIHSFDELLPAMKKFVEEGGSMADIMEVVDLRQAAAFEQMLTSADSALVLRDALNEATGAAKEMSLIIADTLEGDMKELTSAWEGFQISVFTGSGKISKSIRSVLDVTTELLNKLTGYNKTTQELGLDKVAEQMSIVNAQMKDEAEMQKTRSEEDQVYNRTRVDMIKERIGVIEEEQKANNRLRNIKNMKGESIEDEIKQSAILSSALVELNALLLEEELLEKKVTKEKKDKVKVVKDERETLATLKAELKELKSERDLIDITNTKALNRNKKEIETLEDFIKAIEGTSKVIKKEEDKLDFVEWNPYQSSLEDLEKLKQADKELADEQIKSRQRVLDTTKLASDAIFQIMNDNTSRQASRDEKILEERKEAGLITEQEYEQGVERIQRKAFERKKRMDIAQVVIDTALAVAKIKLNTAVALSNPVTAIFAGVSISQIGLAIATGAAQIAVIAAQQFAQGGMIEEFANGGLVHGKSHAQGGEKFAVGGRVVELEGGEAVINKRSTAMFGRQLSAMNAAGGGVKFADGGLLNQPSFSQQQFNAIGQNQMMGAMGSSSKVVVVEADITDSQNSVSVIQSEATI